jgi:hypothetical protein
LQTNFSQRAFDAFSSGDYKNCKELIAHVKKQLDETKAAGKAEQSTTDEKQVSVLQNTLLTNYYEHKGRSPHKFMLELNKLAKQTMSNL